MSAKETVLTFELDAVRALRAAPDRNVVRAALDREEQLLAELEKAKAEEAAQPHAA